MNEKKTVLAISFPDKSIAEAAKISNALVTHLERDRPGIQISKNQHDPGNMDMGSTVVLVLGAPAVVTIAAGIASVLRRFSAKVTITADGELIAENVSGEDVAKMIESRFGSN